jgi:hypothetical membrane protein
MLSHHINYIFNDGLILNMMISLPPLLFTYLINSHCSIKKYTNIYIVAMLFSNLV